jgi:CubicO group peptidase (beta-lactamase class C family)
MNVIRCLVVFLFAASALAQTNSAGELAGLWEAKLRFGPDVRGPLTIVRDADVWRATIAAYSVPVNVAGDAVTFALPDGKGELRARFDKTKAKIVGHWIQPGTVTNGTPYASPVALTKSGANAWRGEVVPLDDEYRFYLKIAPRADGAMSVFFRNPERNLQRWVRMDRVERDGEKVRLLDKDGRALADGVFRDGLLTVFFPDYGGSYDFRRVDANQASDFYPRGQPNVQYVYHPPRPHDDGWAVASVEDVGISREAITKFIQMLIDTPMESAATIEMHGVLIARHRKLVVEEYFHGEHADKPHDTRSGAKSLTATLLGAAMYAGVPLSTTDRVYAVMNGGALPSDLEPRKQAMTLEHLLTMQSGYYCDDNDPNAPGNEDVVSNQTEEPDWYRLTLKLPMESDPGTRAVYCSMVSNLVGGVLSRAAGKPLPVLFHELIAEPMQIRRYHMNLMPTKDAYMGGGVRFLPRDFMKLAQLHMNGGTWNGRRIVAEEWARRATSPLVTISKRGYGYQWWIDDRPYKAGGNGAQIAMAIPELDLVIGFWGGNYSTRETFTPQNVYAPEWIFPAVDESK